MSVFYPFLKFHSFYKIIIIIIITTSYFFRMMMMSKESSLSSPPSSVPRVPVPACSTVLFLPLSSTPQGLC